MENESLREPKNTTVMLLLLLVALVAIWAIIASVMASNRRKDVERISAEKEIIRQDSEQLKQDCLRKMEEAEKLRQTAMEWTRQHQLRIQEEMRKKAEEAAKQAQLKAQQTAKPPVVKSSVPVKGSKHAPVKKAAAKKPVKKAA